MNIQSHFGNSAPIIGQPQVPVMQAVAVITPELVKKLEAWCAKTGLPINEIQNTIFRLGLIMFSVTVNEQEMPASQAIQFIPLSDKEKQK